MHIFEVFRLPFHLGCLDRLQIQHEEKGFIVSASSNMAVLASIWGAFFFLVAFKLPFHALPLLSPHPASFRSFTPGASSLLQLVITTCYYNLLLQLVITTCYYNLLLQLVITTCYVRFQRYWTTREYPTRAGWNCCGERCCKVAGGQELGWRRPLDHWQYELWVGKN